MVIGFAFHPGAAEQQPLSTRAALSEIPLNTVLGLLLSSSVLPFDQKSELLMHKKY